jgi:hypothetical protein
MSIAVEAEAKTEAQAQAQGQVEDEDIKFNDLVPGHDQHKDLIVQSGPIAKFRKPCKFCGRWILLVKWEWFVLEHSPWLVFTAKRHVIDHKWSAWELDGTRKHECWIEERRRRQC